MSVLERVRRAEGSRQAARRGSAAAREARSALKRRLVERLGLDTIAGMLDGSDPCDAREELGVALESIVNAQDGPALGAEERRELVGQVVDEVCGLGPIQALLEDEGVSEVMVNGCEAIFYERDGEVREAQAGFDSPEQIMIVIDRILAPLGRRLDRSSPLVSARLPNGDRVNAVAAPTAIDGPVMTIRKFSERVRTLGTLVGLGSLPAWYARLLAWAVRCRRSVAVAGGTGSGKTTLLNALSCSIPSGERIVTIEDSAELRFDSHPNVVRLEARDASIEGAGEVTIRELVKNALRMRPDRIVVGEVRGEGCVDMLQAMSTGHDGSLTTLHAGSAQEAVLRLVLMARFGMDLPSELVEEQIATAIDLFVVMRRLPDGSRRVTTLTEVSRAEGGGVALRECVSFDEARGSWSLACEPSFVARGIELGLLDEGEVGAWRSCLS